MIKCEWESKGVGESKSKSNDGYVNTAQYIAPSSPTTIIKQINNMLVGIEP